MARADSRAARVPRGSSRRRRPDVVLGAGGLRRRADGARRAPRGASPPPLTEADAHLGLANRLAAPFARRVFLAYAIPGRERRQVPRRRPPDPGSPTAARAARGGRERFGLPADGPVVAVFGGSSRRPARSTSSPSSACGDGGPAGAAPLRRARLRRARGRRVDAPRLRARAADRPLRRGARRLPTSSSPGRAAPCGSSPRPARPRCSSRTRTRPPTTRRRTPATSSAAAAPCLVPDAELDLRRLVDELLADPARLAAMRERDAALARPDAADEIADELVALAEAGRDRGAVPRAARRAAALLRRHRRRRHVRVRERRARLGRRGARLGRARHDLRTRRSTASRSTSAASPRRPTGWEVVVSTAHARHRCRGHRRAASLLAELVALQPVDRRRRRARQDDDRGDDRLRPRASSAATPPGSSAGSCRSSAATPAAGRGGSSSRATSRTARSAPAPADRGRHERRARPPRDVRLGGRGARRSSTSWLAARARRSCASWELERPSTWLSPSPASTTAGTPPRARRARARRRAARGGRRARSRRFARRRAPLRARRRGGRRPRRTTTTATTRPRSRSRSAPRASAPGGGLVRRLPAARLRAHAAPRPRSSARRSGSPTRSIVTDVTGARDAPRPGVTGKLVAGRAAAPVRAGWAPALDDAAALALAWVAPRRPRSSRSASASRGRWRGRSSTGSRGEPPGQWRAASMLEERRRPRAPDDDRHGRPGPCASRSPSSSQELVEPLALRGRERGLGAAVVGLGSNLLAADDGVAGLVLRLAGDARLRAGRGTSLLVAGGGASNAVCLHRARDAGLGGLEFACAIPGTAGGGVWMNAGAYGSDWSAILVRALVVTADGSGWLTPGELGLSYRHSTSARAGRRGVEYRLDSPVRRRRSRRSSPISSRAEGRRSRRTSARSERLQEPGGRSRRRGRCSSSAG